MILVLKPHTSAEDSDTVPSAARELDLAKKLVEEMKGLGIEDARVDDKGYVYGSILSHLYTIFYTFFAKSIDILFDRLYHTISFTL